MSSTPRAVVCVPTYNEHENLEPLVRALAEALDTTRDRVLVIDDASPDGTGELADRLADELPWVEVLHRSAKEGIGRAYLAGFARVLESDATLVLEMDCDFSHDPADVPRLIAACEDGADLALGSRWVDGGGTVNWGLLRRLISRGGSLYARTILGLSVRDLTTGFKAYTRRALERIDVASLRSNGYAFQVETSYRAVQRGLVLVEIPIRFVDRRAGRSKMTAREIAEAALGVWPMRFGRRA